MGQSLLDPAVETFLEVAERGSFTAAAQGSGLTPTAVMKQMNALEARLGSRLFDRSPTGARLTAAGEALRDGARRLVWVSRETVLQAQEASGAAPQAVRVGVSTLYPASLLGKLREHARGFDDRFRLLMVPFEGPINRHLSDFGEKFDLVLGITDSRTVLETCSLLQLGESRYCVAVPWSHPLAGREAVSLSDLRGRRLMVMEPGSSPVNDRLRARIERERPPVEIVDIPQHYDVEVFNRCVREGCALLSLDVWADVHPGLKALPLEEDCAIPLGVIYPKRGDPLVEEFVAALRAATGG